MHRSVETRAGKVELPESRSDEVLAEGARHYAESCAHCHGGPGRKPSEWSRGMRPEPPHLTEAATEWTGEEIHWIVSNGIKMTGMPAFGEHHSAEEISRITAFVTTLLGLSADDYSRMTANAQDRSRETQSSADGDAHREPPAGTSPPDGN
ncbi:cytochrome c [Roseibium salinum]|nr:cytochrome c [Roseibium salinum]